MLPTFSFGGTTRNSPMLGHVFNVRSTPSNLGTVPEDFRCCEGVMRSIDPTRSFGALGSLTIHTTDGMDRALVELEIQLYGDA